MRLPKSLPLIAGLLIVGMCSAGSALAESGKVETSACERTRQAWLAANPLPATYERLLEVDSAHRNLALSAMTPELRSAMWRRHMSEYLESNRDRLDDLQVVQIQKGIDLVSPLFFTFRAETPGRSIIDQAIADFRAEAARVFTPAQFKEIFVKIGLAKGLGTGTGNPEARMPECDCAYGLGYDCEEGAECRPVICSSWTGCGPWGWDYCNAHCRWL
jgi:hypothetical protein